MIATTLNSTDRKATPPPANQPPPSAAPAAPKHWVAISQRWDADAGVFVFAVEIEGLRPFTVTAADLLDYRRFQKRALAGTGECFGINGAEDRNGAKWWRDFVRGRLKESASATMPATEPTARSGRKTESLN